MLLAPLSKLMRGEHLSRAEARAAMQLIMAGNVPPAQVAALLTGLAIKRETVDEVAGFVEAMLAGAERFPLQDGVVADTCGTGGDRSGTFNISTAAAFVAAGAGLTVAKHGNRSMTSKSGSADVLEAAGVAIDQPQEGAVACLERAGITFLFAPAWHPAMKHVGPVRRELGFPTVFNLLGPLANPARPTVQLMGVSRPDLTAFMAEVLAALGTESALVVHGDGLDEISVCAPTEGHWLTAGEVAPFRFSPAELGWEPANPADLLGGTPEENAAMLRGLLKGDIGGAKRRAVLVNAGAALMAAGKVDRLADGVALAESAIDSGEALAKLDALIEYSREARGRA